MKHEQIKYMVDRFLMWKLPENFNPDGGVSFKKTVNEGTSYAHTFAPVGTNLLDAKQAEEMVRYMLNGLPLATERVEELWQELLDKDDRTSPEDCPDMALITFDELADYCSRAKDRD